MVSKAVRNNLYKQNETIVFNFVVEFAVEKKKIKLVEVMCKSGVHHQSLDAYSILHIISMITVCQTWV